MIITKDKINNDNWTEFLVLYKICRCNIFFQHNAVSSMDPKFQAFLQEYFAIFHTHYNMVLDICLKLSSGGVSVQQDLHPDSHFHWAHSRAMCHWW